MKKYYYDGTYHLNNIDGPIVNFDGNGIVCYYANRIVYRTVYYEKHFYHRIDGPAIEESGKYFYWINGLEVSKAKQEKFFKLRSFL